MTIMLSLFFRRLLVFELSGVTLTPIFSLTNKSVFFQQVKASQVKSTFFPTSEFTSIKKIRFSITEINIEIKITSTAVVKTELKYFPEGNTCIVKVEILTFI